MFTKEFDFDAISVLGLKINLPKGKAAELGSATGLGSCLCESVCDLHTYTLSLTLCYAHNHA